MQTDGGNTGAERSSRRPVRLGGVGRRTSEPPKNSVSGGMQRGGNVHHSIVDELWMVRGPWEEGPPNIEGPWSGGSGKEPGHNEETRLLCSGFWKKPDRQRHFNGNVDDRIVTLVASSHRSLGKSSWGQKLRAHKSGTRPARHPNCPLPGRRSAGGRFKSFGVYRHSQTNGITPLHTAAFGLKVWGNGIGRCRTLQGCINGIDGGLGPRRTGADLKGEGTRRAEGKEGERRNPNSSK